MNYRKVIFGDFMQTLGLRGLRFPSWKAQRRVRSSSKNAILVSITGRSAKITGKTVPLMYRKGAISDLNVPEKMIKRRNPGTLQSIIICRPFGD